MGTTDSHLINYEKVKSALEMNKIIINTLDTSEQNNLINSTIVASNEEEVISNILRNNIDEYIIIYGRNCIDDSVDKKYHQLTAHGLKNVYIYRGGMFEWLCLQDIFGEDMFPTTSKELNILKYNREM